MRATVNLKIAFLVLLLLPQAPGRAAADTVRAGMFVGSNRGVFSEDPLFYANEDAMKMYLLFREYGKVDVNLSLLLQKTDREGIKSGLSNLEQRIRLLKSHSDSNLECVFYYSGHGGADGLHLDGRTYPYRELYDDLNALSCDLLIVVLDACNSGNFLKVKGVVYSKEEFRVKIYDTKTGEVFITSSADSEYSQEKDEFKGAVFTYYLANGLLGAADIDKNGLVTLSEAYNFASKKTMQETFGSARGFQVPTYKYQVEGRQDTVLTELEGERRLVYAPEGSDGIMTFMEVDKGIIFGDFQISGKNRKIYIPRGEYLVRLRDSAGKLYLGECSVGSQENPQWGDFEVISKDQDPLKGRRVLHHIAVRLTGGARFSPDNQAIRRASFGGSVAVLVENFIIPPLYIGISAGAFTGTSNERVFGENVEYSSLLVLVDGVFGLTGKLSRFLEISGELRAGGGYARLSRRVCDHRTYATGALFGAGAWGHATWRLSGDIGLLLPSLHLSLLLYQQDGSPSTTLDYGAGAGLVLLF
jgi:hypothetical protein